MINGNGRSHQRLMLFQLFAIVLKPEIWMHSGHLFHLFTQGSFHVADEDCTGVLVGKCNRDVQGKSLLSIFMLLSNQNPPS